MKLTFYPKLAFLGIRKNKRLYVPYISTCAGMTMMYYIVSFLAFNSLLDYLPGKGVIGSTMFLGSFIIALFAVLFLFYTHSFLMRSRKKEFGLYNILGMGKKNICLVLFWETLMTTAISLFTGLFAGIAFSKFAELGLINFVHADVSYSLSLSPKAVQYTVLLFCAISALLFFHALHQIHSANPIALLHSGHSGEKPPKSNWLLGLLGLVLLCAAYYIAVTIKTPLEALLWFFVAVAMVILATYLLFIAGSVLLCKRLQKNKRYYYKPNHFVSVSSMVWRMKRNGASLASICILGTMVLVMITGSACLYFGTEDSLRTMYPKDFRVRVNFNALSEDSDALALSLRQVLYEQPEAAGIAIKNLTDYREAALTGLLLGDELVIDYGTVQEAYDDTERYAMLRQLSFVPLSDYNRLAGTELTLEMGEALLCPVLCDYPYPSLTVDGGISLKSAGTAINFFKSEEKEEGVLPSIIVVLPDFHSSLASLASLKYPNGQVLRFSWQSGFDTDVPSSAQIALSRSISDAFSQAIAPEETKQLISSYVIHGLAVNREVFYAEYGSVFFLGIMLSIVFLFATVLMIYYKQISEGYEDEARFEIMQNIGMTKPEIRKSINSQIRMVFFLPLAAAVLHLSFAFPLIEKLLLIFKLTNLPLLLATTCVSVLIFALFYTFVYRITSNAYYSIVSGAAKK